MYEEYLTKALSSIIIAKQALKNYEKTNIKDMKNEETEQWLIQIRPRYKAKLADVNWSCDMAERSQMRKCFLSHLALLCMTTFYIRVLQCEQSHTSVASPS